MSDSNEKDAYKQNRIEKAEEAKVVRKYVAIILASLFVLLIIALIIGFFYVKSALGPVKKSDDTPIELTIPLGSSTSSIASILKEHDVIKDERVFRLYTKVKNKSDFQAGDYTFSKSLSVEEITEMLKDGRLVAEPYYTVTIPEGKTIEEMAEIFAEELPFTDEEFLEVVNDEAFITDLIARYPELLSDGILQDDIRTPLEGYLFASTYSYYEKEPAIESIVEEMLQLTNNLVIPYEEQLVERDLSIHEAVTFASLLEKESRTEDERKKISGLFYNRLEEGMKLQTDPTVLYALGEHKDRVLYEDLEVESPYNTYYVDALPIGPISNFSQDSFEAVVYPEESDYIYFLHDSDGKIYYSETLEKHNELKEKHITDKDEKEKSKD
ncbi:MAG TPA: endolytic transglycosylase MltG [Bacillota bacterium]|nr:endolytic transglycosylase MltG [Bacillota bacterium]